MIPRTYPSTFAPNGQNQMVVFLLTSVVGLVKWTDYIPVKWSTSSLGRENDYGNNSFVNIDQVVTLVGGQKPFVDYIPVFVDASATIPWSTNAGGYIPINVSLSTPVALFSAGEQGAWYDPSDMSTMFQDSAGTTPVTAVGQPVGLIRDKSGRNNHAFQTTTTKRPLYQSAGGYSYLAFDGIDDSLVTNSINFTSTDKMTVWAGFSSTNTSIGFLYEIGDTDLANSSASGFTVRDFVDTGVIRTFNSIKAQTRFPITLANKNVIAEIIDVVKAGLVERQLRVNNNEVAGSVLVAGNDSGNFANAALFIGQRNQTQFALNGNLYSLVIRGAQSSDAQIASTEQYVNGKTGAY